MKTKTQFTFRMDTWTPDGESIVEHIAGNALLVPSNISLVPLPPRAPELNGQENIWQFMRQNWLSNRIFKSFDDIALTPLLLRLEHIKSDTGIPSAVSAPKVESAQSRRDCRRRRRPKRR
jgi:hypothetical protein